jgi:Cysteine-rich secretory protein family
MPTILPELPKVEAAIVEITNTVRAEAKLGQVVISPQLTAAARAYAQLLARTGQFSHEADGKLADRTQRVGYEHCAIGENLASHQDSRGFETRALAKSAMEGWLNSPGHRQNIVTAEMTETGVAVAKAPDKDGKYIAVQLFGRPQSLAISFQVSNASKEPVAFAFQGKTHEVPLHAAFTMQSCSAGPVSFATAKGKAAFATHPAASGKTYVVTGGGGASLTVEVKERQTVK